MRPELAMLFVMFRTLAQRSLLLIVMALWLAPHTARAQERFEFVEMHMAMPVRVVLYASDTTAAREAARATFAQIASLEATMSDYRPQSELRRLVAKSGSWVTVSAPLFDVVALALEVARKTRGAFDPTVAPVVALWREARRSGHLPDPAELAKARSHVGFDRVQLDSGARRILLPHGMSLDLGGIAKGYILQQAIQVLSVKGVSSALVDAGGDIVVTDAPPSRRGWTVDIPEASPAFRAHAAALVRAAMATSGPTFQYVEAGGVRYSHVVDPRTGQALTHAQRALVLAADAAVADALATALTVLDEHERREVLRAFPGVTVEVLPVR